MFDIWGYTEIYSPDDVIVATVFAIIAAGHCALSMLCDYKQSLWVLSLHVPNDTMSEHHQCDAYINPEI